MRVLSAGASVIGTSHLDDGQPCQDAFHVLTTPGAVVACVADGAGSAARSDEGARVLVQIVCDALAADALACLTDADGFERVAASIASARELLEQLGPLADFHATLCAVVITPLGTLVVHLGDGLILGVNPENWDEYVASEPDNGEFAETTYFFTLPGWRRRLRVMCAPARFRTWFLMSDGAAGFAAETRPYRPAKNFLQPVHRYLMTVDTEVGSQALSATLADPRTDRITSDDKTLVWLHVEPTAT